MVQLPSSRVRFKFECAQEIVECNWKKFTMSPSRVALALYATAPHIGWIIVRSRLVLFICTVQQFYATPLLCQAMECAGMSVFYCLVINYTCMEGCGRSYLHLLRKSLADKRLNFAYLRRSDRRWVIWWGRGERCVATDLLLHAKAALT